MKVALVNPYPYYASGIESTIYPPLGLLYIGRQIKPHINSLLVLDANALKINVQATYDRLKTFKPDMVGISINIATVRAARELAILIKRSNPEILLVSGGPHPTVFPEKWLEYMDVVITGEGEISFLNLIERLKHEKDLPADIPGVCIKGGPITFSPHVNPDEIGFPAYEQLEPPLKFYTKGARVIKPFMASILTSRGCPYNCSFCDKSVHGSNFRPRSFQSVIDEIYWLKKEYGINQIDILDDNFTFDTVRAEKILDGIIRIGGLAINCQNGLRADRLNEELIRKMKLAGVFKTGIGIESGSADILRRIDKKLDLDQVRLVIKWLRKEKITVHGYFIIGFPFESSSDIEKSLKFAIDANPHFANFSNYLPIPGTRLFNYLKDQSKLIYKEFDDIDTGFFREKPLAYLDNISSRKVEKLYKEVWRSFYLRPYKIIDILKTIKSFREFFWILKIAFSVLKRRLIVG